MPPGLLYAIFGGEMARAVATISKTTPVFDDHSFVVISRKKKNLDDYFGCITRSPLFLRRVKCADRLDNLNSMHVWTPERQMKYIKETRQYVLPLAYDTDSGLAAALEKACGKYE